MRLLIVHNIAWSHYKAAVFNCIAQEMPPAMTDFRVVHLALTSEQRKSLSSADLGFHRYPYEILFNTSLNAVPTTKKALKLLKFLRDHPSDVVVLSGYDDAAYWAAMIYLKIFTRTKIAVTVDSTQHDNARVFYKEFVKKVFLKCCDMVFCYGSAQIAYLKTLGVSDRKIRIRVQATDNQRIRKDFLIAVEARNGAKRNNSFLYVGRLSGEKNLFLLLEAFTACQAKGWKLEIVGDGPSSDALKKMVEDKKIADVHFTGPLAWHEISRIYAGAGVLVLPSLSEPWGLVVNEAMLCEMPVIVSNHCGAAPDLVKEGVNGFTFNPHDCASLQEKLQFFIDNPQSIETFGKSSYHIIRDFTPEKAATQITSGFLELTSQTVNAV